MQALCLWLYALLMQVAAPLLRRKLARRALAELGYAQAVPERWGQYTQAPETASELVWVHAVSLGETRTAAILLREWRARSPGLRVLMTHGTATGREQGLSLLQPGDVQVWQPWDSRAAVDRFLTHFKPRLGVLLETEVWPNLMAAAQARGLSVALVNARLSPKSLASALRLAWLARPAYRALAAVYAQTEADGRRLAQLGAPVAGVLGNLKFDARPDDFQQALARKWRTRLEQPVLMLASSREGEEIEFLRQWQACKLEAQPETALKRVLIVPRHPQRFDEVAQLVLDQGLSVSRRSQWAGAPGDDPVAMQADVWLGDSLGEMALYYTLSDMALLGGSFEALGGQNLIEAAACRCPVVMGPHTFNFAQAAEMAQDAGAALARPDMASALQAAMHLLEDPVALEAASSASWAFAQTHRGAALRLSKALDALWQGGAKPMH